MAIIQLLRLSSAATEGVLSVVLARHQHDVP